VLKPLATFGEPFRMFGHAVEIAFLTQWLPKYLETFAAHRANLGLKMA
jgi:hypothetical protein